MNSKKIVTRMLEMADIDINGDRAWDIKVHNENLYARVVTGGTLGFGDSYMDGWWDCDAIDVMIYKVVQKKLEHYFSVTVPVFVNCLLNLVFNLQTRRRAGIVAKKHYDFSNEMFESMLGKSMAYSCGYWSDAENLDDAQFRKMDMICKKIDLKEGMRVVDIGCGWGSLARYMAEKYGARVTGVSVSKNQIEYARSISCNGKVEWKLQDYRLLEGTFDRVVSVGMFEHVGRKNYKIFMDKTREILEDDGMFLLHTIGSNSKKTGVDPWIAKHIFPNGMLPTLSCIGNACSGRYVMEDWHNFGADYDRTLMAWHERFEAGYEANEFECDERARRMFRYYLLSCAGAFRARDLQVWQVMLSPCGVPGGYNCR